MGGTCTNPNRKRLVEIHDNVDDTSAVQNFVFWRWRIWRLSIKQPESYLLLATKSEFP